MTPRIDPVTQQVVMHALYSVSDEMNGAMVRTAYSTNIKDRRDCSTAIFTPAGALVAQSAFGTPLHLGVLPFTVRTLLDQIPVEAMEPGDDYIVNLPYPAGPGHLNDITIVSPLFWRDRLVAVLGNAAHHVDVGGGAPGSMPFGVHEIYQEGLQIPPLRIVHRGELQQDLVALIAQNVRTAREFLGDLLAQIAANNVGEVRLGQVLDRHGDDVFSAYVPSILDYSERRIRAGISALPGGRWSFEDVLEGDGLTDDLIRIHVTVEIREGEITMDFTETSDQVAGPLNCRPPSVIACARYVTLCLTDPDLRPNDGVFRPVHVVTRPGSLFEPTYPAAVCNANILTTQRIVDAILGAIAQADENLVPAACSGTMNLINIGGTVPDTGGLYNYVETYGGGQGAMPTRDGESGIHTHMTNTRNAPVEQIEASYPLFVERYELVPDSEGPGFLRGGFGMLRELRVLSDATALTLSSDRHRFGPWGLGGGGDGRPGSCRVISSDEEVDVLPSKVTRAIGKGCRVISVTPGGGGRGIPFARDVGAVLEDVEDGLVTRERAEAVYGVVCSDVGEIDEAATALLRRPNESSPSASRELIGG